MDGIFVPAGTPVEIINFLNEALNRAIQAPEIREKLNVLGAVTRTNTPAECAAFPREQLALRGRIVQEANIRIE